MAGTQSDEQDAKEGRDESAEERHDRNWDDLLQELRVMQTGVQLLAGFMLTLPLQQKFSRLDSVQTGLYLVLVVLAGLTLTATLTPIAVHRRLFGDHVKGRVVRAGHLLVRLVLFLLCLLSSGVTVFVFDIVVGRTTAVVVGGCLFVIQLVAMLVVPRLVGGRGARSNGR